ncbi:Phorbol-ester/DAG-type domain-containing protein [Heracleum sosnowskyi]|uniref:Phorbol-ester/DAG-type domain-containing protein n=1 Tax=Heracleum sosnowskyi TaxID=360622 RepID=A0AAD8MQ38_9APIA|nr:Phorbol-ester/DAG-type domain-containing protein [Heracleum sosnowskyi]
MNKKKKKTKEKRIKHCSRKEYDFQACGTDEGSKDFSYLCKTCLFFIHNRCASAPPKLIFKSHDIDHPLVLDYSLPEEYQIYGVSCNLCREEVDPSLWLYYCAYCRYFAHMKCVLSAIESGEDRNINEDVGDVDDPDLVHFPVSEDNPSLLYQLIQKFAENFSTSTDERSGGKADKISHCCNGHSLVLFDELNNKKVVETESSESMICDGCVQPILSPPDSFYGCIDCNFFLHTICAAELPREIQHASHPQHKLIRCDRMSKPNAFFTCGFCYHLSSGMFYRCDSCKLYIDLVCAAMPSEIKHAAHKHKLIHDNLKGYRCAGCGWNFGNSFRCDICNYKIDVRCARKPGRNKHRWDEHQLCMMYPPVKGHPHDFNCERCSSDIDPNSWFYHCRECDTSFHDECLDQVRFRNIKCGAIVKDDDLHQHSLKISPPVSKFKCGSCGIYNDDYRRTFYDSTRPILTCVSCKFSVCYRCQKKRL